MISSIGNLIVLEDTSQTVSFTVTDGPANLNSLTFTVTSTDPNLIAPSAVRIQGSGVNRHLEFTPEPDATGITTITVSVDNGQGETVNTSFIVTVNPVALPWRNPQEPMNVNDDGVISALDALLIIAELNARGGHVLEKPIGSAYTTSYFYDVSGDGSVTSIDALILINDLNTLGARAVSAPARPAPEGEPTLPLAWLADPFTAVPNRDPPRTPPIAAAVDQLITLPATPSPSFADAWQDESAYEPTQFGQPDRLIDTAFEEWDVDWARES